MDGSGLLDETTAVDHWIDVSTAGFRKDYGVPVPQVVCGEVPLAGVDGMSVCVLRGLFENVEVEQEPVGPLNGEEGRGVGGECSRKYVFAR